MTTREYGLLIASRNSYGTDYITATVVVREDGGDSPLNPWSDGECSYYGTPKHLDGLQLDGFGMHGHVMTGNDPAYIGYAPEFREVFAIDERRLARMAATFHKIRRQFAKDMPAEPGDTLMSLAASLRLTFACWRIGDAPERSSYSDNRWRWATIPEGRDYFRRVVAEAVQRASGKAVA